MTRVRLLLQYQGTRFQGWQKQPHTDLTVQTVLENALSRLLDEPIKTVASGRTDSGTHSLGQTVHFDTSKPTEKYQWPYSINSILPEDIRVRRAWVAPEEFHALHSCSDKTYKYVIQPFGHNLFDRQGCWQLRSNLSLESLNTYCAPLRGEHDFASFQTAGTDVPDTVRTLSQCHWTRASRGRLVLTISANGFLKQMVRNIVGTQVSLARKEAPADQIKRILRDRDRRSALETAPAHGLYIFKVRYPRELDIRCRRL